MTARMSSSSASRATRRPAPRWRRPAPWRPRPAAPASPLAAARPPPDPGSGVFAAVPKPAKVAAEEAAEAREAESGSGVFGAVGRRAAAAARPAPRPRPPRPRRRARGRGPVDLTGAPAAYPGDDAPKEQIAAWMASEAEKRGLPAQLPVMAALVESSLSNVDFGDADSLGYFQMRVSIWERDYPGFAKDPEKQIDWFLDTAEGVKEQRIARGQSIDDPSQFGEWIADVERPAEQYRGRYQLRLDEANKLLADAPRRTRRTRRTRRPGTRAAARRPPTRRGRRAAGDGAGPGPQALAALKEAEKYTGTPYKWGGSTPQTGFDCSGLVQWAYAQAGVKIPRVTDQQIEATNGTAGAPRRAAARRPRVLPRPRAATSTTSGSRWAATSSCTPRTPATS